MDDLKDEDDNSLCLKDCDTIRPVLESYGITDLGGEGKPHIMNDNGTFKKIFTVMRDLKKRFTMEPDKNFLIVFVLAGHGMQVSGQ